MVRECRPPAREPVRSWLARRSTMATSTPANASSPANISPVGPPPVITTACSVIGTLRFGTGLTTSPPVRYILKRGGQDETASIDDGLLVVSSRKAAPMPLRGARGRRGAAATVMSLAIGFGDHAADPAG